MQSSDRRSILEMTIIKLCNPSLCEDYESLEKRVRNLENGYIVASPVKSEPLNTEKTEKKREEIKEEPPVKNEKKPVKEAEEKTGTHENVISYHCRFGYRYNVKALYRWRYAEKPPKP
jgi:hypothetical protein